MKWLEKGLHAQQRYEQEKAKNEQTGEYSLNCFFFASSSTQNGCTSPIRQPRSGDVGETCPWDRTGTLAVGNTKGGPTLNARLGCAAETSTKEKKSGALGPKENEKKKQYDCRVLCEISSEASLGIRRKDRRTMISILKKAKKDKAKKKDNGMITTNYYSNLRLNADHQRRAKRKLLT